MKICLMTPTYFMNFSITDIFIFYLFGEILKIID